MIIRPATIRDTLAIQRLLVQLGYPDLDSTEVVDKINEYAKENYQLLVSETEQEVTGFISLHCFDIFHSTGKIGRITAFCVDEHSRSQGIGIKLLEAAEAFFIQQGCTKLEVTSNNRRTQTHAFYLKRGYTEDSRRFVKFL